MENLDLRDAQEQVIKLAEALARASSRIESAEDKELTLKERQENMLKRQLEYMGYQGTSTKDLTKVTVDLTKEQREILKVAEKKSKLDKEMLRLQEESGKVLRENVEKYKSMGSVYDGAREKIFGMVEGSKTMTASLLVTETAIKGVGIAVTTLASAFTSMASSLLAGERGQTVASKGILELGRGVKNLTSLVGGLAVGLGALPFILAPLTGGLSLLAGVVGGLLIGVGGLTIAAGQAAEKLAEFHHMMSGLLDKTFDAFKQFGQLSMTGAKGMTDLVDSLHAVGLSISQFEKLTKVVGENAKEMKMFGANMEDGLKNFALNAGALINSELGLMFEKMGISQDDLMEHTAKYMAQQIRFGNAISKNTEEVTKKTANYIEELDKIAALTGASRKEQEDARKAVMSIEQLRAAMASEKDPEKKAAMERFARMAEIFMANNMKTTAMQFARYASGGFGPTSLPAAELHGIAGNQLLSDIYHGRGDTMAWTQGYMGRFGQRQSDAGGIARFMENPQIPGYMSELYAPGQDMIKRLASGILMPDRVAKDKDTVNVVQTTRDMRQSAIEIEESASAMWETSVINKWASEKFSNAVDVLVTYLAGKNGTAGIPSLQSATTAAMHQGMTHSGKGTPMADLPTGPNLNDKNTMLGSFYDTDSLRKLGLRVKDGVQKGRLNPRLIELAIKAQAAIPELIMFTAFNDAYHQQNAPDSQHTSGNAFDFRLSNVSSHRAQEISNTLLDLGLIPQNELRRTGPHWTGPHFHASLKGGKNGGIFDGPSSGYPVMLHGREAVIPGNQTEALSRILDKVDKETLSSLNSGSPTTVSGVAADASGIVSMLSDLYDVMAEKLDSVVEQLEQNNSIQEKILRVSRA